MGSLQAAVYAAGVIGVGAARWDEALENLEHAARIFEAYAVYAQARNEADDRRPPRNFDAPFTLPTS